jgi:outer membrane protein assembly factor BamD
MHTSISLTLFSRFVGIFFLCLSSLMLGGCSTFDGMFDTFTFGRGEKENTDMVPAEGLIVQGMDAYNVGNYYKSLKAFNQILDQYPFSKEATLAELKAADSHFYTEEYVEAKALYLEFEERHPTNEAIAYVMFQVGMCDFRRTDRIDRDITGAQEAIQDFSKLLRSFPSSPYTREAKAHTAAAREFLVNHEYFVAVFYVRTEKYEQALHRLDYLISMYPDASIMPKAKDLRVRLAAGEPPKWGIRGWLPELTMPDVLFWDSDEGEEVQEFGTLPENNTP